MPKPKKGLRVKFCENVASYTAGKCHKLKAAVADGWFIQVWYDKAWYSLMDLRFGREKDALRAAQSLTAAGLDSHGAINRADPLTVMQVATEFLQW
jgi:hypothetical protein